MLIKIFNAHNDCLYTQQPEGGHVFMQTKPESPSTPAPLAMLAAFYALEAAVDLDDVPEDTIKDWDHIKADGHTIHRTDIARHFSAIKDKLTATDTQLIQRFTPELKA